MRDAANKTKATGYRIALSRSQAQRLAVQQGKSITDAPDLRAAEWRCCAGCKFFKVVDEDWGEAAADGLCSKYDFGAEGDWVCDSWQKPEPAQMDPLPVVIVDDAGAAIPVTLVEGGKALAGNALKAISKTDSELRVGNYLVLFGGRDLSGIGAVDATGRQLGLTERNGDGSLGEFFTKATDFSSPYVEADVVAVDWEHGFEPETDARLRGPGRDDVLGRVDWKSARVDDKGLFVERVLNRRNAYVQWIESLVEAGLVGTSSKCIDGQREVKATGEITRWALERDTLTVTPYEPRMLSVNTLAAIKALRLEAKAVPTPGAQTPEASQGAARAAGAPPDARDTGTSTDKETVMPNEFEASVTKSIDLVGESVKGIATTVAALDGRLAGVEKALKSEKPGASGVEVTLDEADRPFKSMAAQIIALKRYQRTQGQEMAPRLKALDNLAKATGANEGLGSDGGFLLEPTVTAEVLKPMHEDGPFSKMVNELPVGPNSNAGTINGVDETSRATGSRWGGVQGYRVAEAGTLTGSRPKFREIAWKLKKYAVLVYGTDELLADAPQFAQIVKQGGGEELMFMVNDDILNGLGQAGPKGVLVSGALVSVAKETGQAAATIVQANISKMWARLHARSKGSAVWFVNTDCNPSLDTLFIPAGVSALEPRVVSYDANGVMRIKGRPVIETEFNATCGTVGDIVLADMSQYLFWTKGGVQDAQSIHVAFTTDESVFRLIYRCDGQTALASAITPYKGTATVSPFVALATRA